MKEIKLPTIDQAKVKHFQEEAYPQILADSECARFIQENHIPMQAIKNCASSFLRFIKDKKICERCTSIKTCTKQPEKIRYTLVYDDVSQLVDLSFVTCDLYEKEKALKKKYIAYDFPIEWLHFDFRDLMNEQDGYFNERKKLLKFFLDFKKQPAANGAYIYGNTRIGKSFVSVLFTKEYIEKTGKNVAFVHSGDACKNFLDLQYSDKAAAQAYLHQLQTVPLLILDDFGNEYKTDFIRDSFMYPLLSMRSSLGLATFFTSSYELKDIEKMYQLSFSGAPKAQQLRFMIERSTEIFLLGGLPYPF